jgi:hypothetical protein
VIPLPLVWVGAKKFLAGIPPVVWAGVIGLVLVLGWGHLRYNAGQANVQAKFDAYRADLKAKTAEAARLAKAAQEAQAGAIKAAVEDYKKGLSDAKATGDAVAAGVRDGSLRLQDHWRGCPPVPGPAGGGPVRDAGADVRAASAGRVVAAGAGADAQVRALQAIIRSAPHCFKVP